MATLTERFDGRRETVSDDQPQATIEYLAEACTDEDEVKALCEASMPLYYGDLKRTSFEVGKRLNETTWEVTGTWELDEDAEASTSGVTATPSVSATSTTVHIENSIATAAVFGPGADQSVVGNSNPIDFDGETIRGADTLESVFTFSVTQTMASSFVTFEYRALLAELTGCVNSLSFLGHAAGTVLYTGANGSKADTGEWEFTFNFSVKNSPPAHYVGSIFVGYDGIVGVVGAAGGWDLEWVRYEDQVPAGSTTIKRVPVEVRIEQIYRRADLNRLGVVSF